MKPEEIDFIYRVAELLYIRYQFEVFITLVIFFAFHVIYFRSDFSKAP